MTDQTSTGSRARLVAIVAMDPDRVIGRGGILPWHLPEDLAFFKRVTSGHPVVMGRKTFESIGRPLPNRHNIVLTRNPVWRHQGVTVIQSPADFFSLPLATSPVFVIGGAEVYQIFLPLLDEILVSLLRQRHEGDTRFPPFEDLFPHRELVESHPGFEVWRHSRCRPCSAAPLADP